MSVLTVTTKTGDQLDVNVPDTFTTEQIHQAAANALSHYESTQQASSRSFMDQVNGADATNLIKQAAPSNLLKLAGVGTQNAPGVAGAVLNSLPGIGNPAQIMLSLQNVQQNPSQGKEALRRIALVNAGGALTPQEVKPALAGQAAGTALEMMTPSLGTKNIKASNPFMAGVKEPSTALPGTFEKAGQELGAAKIAARSGENAADAARLRVMLQKPAGVTKLAEEGKALLESGKDVPVTRLLAYREALGKVQAEGGSFANDYKVARDAADELLSKKAPELVSKLKKMAVNYAARGNPKASFPWFTFALNPEVGLAKAATLPVVQNTLGAVASPLVTDFPKVAAGVNTAVNKSQEKEPVEEIKPMAKTLTKEKAKEFLKEAKGDRDKARQLAKDAGYEIPKKK